MDIPLEKSSQSRYGIAKLTDHNYQNWSFQCRMVLSEYKLWKVVTGQEPYPKTVEKYEAELAEDERLTDTARKKIQKEVDEWDERDQQALRIIGFTVSDQLLGPVRSSSTAKEAWNELMQIHAPNDKQRKFSLLRRLYRLDMSSNSSLIEHERVFDNIVQSLAAIGKMIDPDELIILYANSLPVDIFSNWIQSQMAFVDKMTITEFKGRVREEARRLNIHGLNEGLGVERDPDTVQANMAKSNVRIFPPKKGKPTYPPSRSPGRRLLQAHHGTVPRNAGSKSPKLEEGRW